MTRKLPFEVFKLEGYVDATAALLPFATEVGDNEGGPDPFHT